ncbi:hypothetical protein [Rhizobium sp. NLR22b]|nr:hypothetical protein [Rhizobium sp. NLR22b]MBX5241652.1 hypothetical protein [Rhizobium sp. NLR22b]
MAIAYGRRGKVKHIILFGHSMAWPGVSFARNRLMACPSGRSGLCSM